MLNYRPVDWHLPVYDNKLQPWQVDEQATKVSIALSRKNRVTLSPPSPTLDSLALDPHYLLFFCCQLALDASLLLEHLLSTQDFVAPNKW